MSQSNITQAMDLLAGEILRFAKDQSSNRYILGGFSRRRFAYALLARQCRAESNADSVETLTEVRRRIERQGVMSYGASARHIMWLRKEALAEDALANSLSVVPTLRLTPKMTSYVLAHADTWFRASTLLGLSATPQSGCQPTELSLREQQARLIALDDTYNRLTDTQWRERIQSLPQGLNALGADVLLFEVWRLSQITSADSGFKLNKAALARLAGRSRSSCSQWISALVQARQLRKEYRGYQITDLGSATFLGIVEQQLRAYEYAGSISRQ